MYVCQLTFEVVADLELDMVQRAISKLLDEYRYNGQIIGREFPVIFTGEHFEVLFVCPEQDSISPEHNNQLVTEAFEDVVNVGLSLPNFELKGLESQSDFVDVCEQPSELVVYSTFVQSCSPVRCLEHFSPVPLYKFPVAVRKPLVKWQESHAACDQLQMNELSTLEKGTLAQLSELDSELNTKARELAKHIEQASGSKVYLYLYRVGGDSLLTESQRKCPGCGGDWKLEQPLFDLFDFKCENCQLVSNISWNWQ